MEPSPSPDVTGPLARQLAEVWAQGDLEGALHRAADLISRWWSGGAASDEAAADASALFLVGEDGIAAEAWPSEDGPKDVERRLRYRQAALEGPHADPRYYPRSGLAVIRRPLPGPMQANERAPAALAWVRATEGEARAHGATGLDAAAAPLLDLLAWKVASVREAGRHAARQEQYERWFKTLDAQLRILDRERQKFAAIVNQSDTCAFVIDASGTITWHNKATAQIVGDAAGDGADEGWAGRRCADLCARLGLHEPGEGCAACPVMRAFRENAAVHREVHAPGGSELYLTALPIKGPDGRPFEVLAQVQDLTNLEVVRRAKDRLTAVISGAPIVLFAVDRDGVFTLSEGKGLESLGLAPGQAVGQSVFELYHGYPSIAACIRRAMAGETVADSVELGPLAYETTYAPLRDVNGSIQGVIGVATDITERRRAERALQESEEKLRHAQRLESVGSLAGGVAHDFNNLLTAMFGHLTFLRDRVAGRPELSAEIEAIERAANRAATLTRQLLAFSRKQVLQLRVVDLNQVLGGMEPMLRRLLGADVELAVRLDAARPWIRADVGQMEQVVVNLVVNARDAMPRGGRLTIRTLEVAEGSGPPSGLPAARAADVLRNGPCVALLVADTGAGMSPETLARAFEPFFTTKPAGEGTGLGLSTVYGIVKQSGGEVYVDSGEGAGATFTLCFPRTARPEPDAGRAQAVPSLTPGSGTILLVEDEPMVRELFRDVLETAGYRVLEAKNGIEAMETASRHAGVIDLLVTDVIMPGMSGGELVRRMADVRPDMRVLYVSGYTDDVLVRRGVIEAGASFLQKPCLPDELSRVVRTILGPI